MLDTINLPIDEITAEILRNYLADYKSNSSAGMVTIDNIRKTLSSFFAWLENEDYIVKSPVRRIYKVKATKKVKETFLGKEANINKVYPHKFRRTMATMAMVNQNNVKNSHRKYIT